MYLWLPFFVFFLIILWQSSNQVLVRVKRTARGFGVSEIAVTLLGLSVLASLPEFLISILAAVEHNSQVSLGTVVGSNLFTLLVVLGLAAIIKPFHVKMVIEERDSVWMLLSGAVLLIFSPGGISRWEGVFLVILYFPYIYSVYLREKKKGIKTPTKSNRKLKRGKELFLLTAITLIMLASAEGTLRSGLEISAILHIPKLIMGLVLIGIGASIPETAIGILAALKRKTDITLGDVYGTNIFTVLFILGVSAIIHPIPVTAQVQTFIIPFFIFSTIILQLFFATSHRIGRLEGAFLIATYLYFALATIGFLPKP